MGRITLASHFDRFPFCVLWSRPYARRCTILTICFDNLLLHNV